LELHKENLESKKLFGLIRFGTSGLANLWENQKPNKASVLQQFINGLNFLIYKAGLI